MADRDQEAKPPAGALTDFYADVLGSELAPEPPLTVAAALAAAQAELLANSAPMRRVDVLRRADRLCLSDMVVDPDGLGLTAITALAIGPFPPCPVAVRVELVTGEVLTLFPDHDVHIVPADPF